MAPCTLEDLDNFIKTVTNHKIVRNDDKLKFREFNVEFKTHVVAFEIKQVSALYEVKLDGVIKEEGEINPIRFASNVYQISPCELSQRLIKLSTILNYDILETELKLVLASTGVNIVEFNEVIESLKLKGIQYKDITNSGFPEVEFVKSGENTKIKLVSANFSVNNYMVGKSKQSPTYNSNPVQYVKNVISKNLKLR